MKSTTLTPQQYFDKIKPLRTPEEIKAVCEELTTGLFNETDVPKTRVNKLTRYNKLINTIANEELVEGENAYIQNRADGSFWKRHLHFRFTGIEKTNFNGEDGINTKTIVLDRLENQQEVDVNKYLEITSKLLLSEDPHELAVGLIAASGRRLVEILARGSFTLAVDLPDYLKPGYFVKFKGQVKKRDYGMPEDERVEYRIGLLVPAEFFIKAFKRFRQMPEAKEILTYLKEETRLGVNQEDINKKINDRRGNSLRRVTIAFFGEFLPKRHDDDELNTKALRAVYVALITKRDCPQNINPLLWASRSVGHFVDTSKVSDRDLFSLVTTLGYSDYYVTGDVPFMPTPHKSPSEKAISIRAFATDVETIKKLQKDWELPSQMVVVRNLITMAEKTKQLEAQLLDARAQIAQLTKEKEEMTVPQSTESDQQPIPNPQDLQVMIRQLIAEELQKALPQIQSQQPVVGVATPQSTRQPKPKAEQPEKDWESVASQELKTSKHRGAALEKIRRAFLAITNHNDHKARDNSGQPDVKQMWVINNQALRQLSGCNGMMVGDWMQRHHGAISDHNNKYGLGQYHNKGRGDITQVINW
jgi:Telomere resolvase